MGQTLNQTHPDLHNCTALVELRGKGGDSVQNLYFIPLWKAGTPIHAKCSPGIDLFEEKVGRRTIPQVESIVSVWSDEMTLEPISYNYAGRERDADIERYCQDLKISARYRPFSGGMLWNMERGVVLRLKGLEFLPAHKVTVTFRSKGSELSLAWDLDRWANEEEKTLDSRGKLPWDPEGCDVVLSFPDTSYVHRSSWKFPYTLTFINTRARN